MSNYYDILGVSKSANQTDIKKAYHKMAMKYHPDRNPGNASAEQQFKQAGEAYDVLKDDQKRAAYDNLGHNAFKQHQSTGGGSANHGGGFHGDINDVFNDFFSDFMGGGNQRSSRSSGKSKGADLKYNITVTLEEAFHGADKDIKFSTEIKCKICSGSGSADSKSMTSCNTCGGMGKVRIQQGFFVIEQTCSKCQGVGQVIKNPCKKCHGIGRHPEQKSLRINIPSGIENGARIRLIGEGEAGIRGGNVGDLYVFVSIMPNDIYKVEGANLHCKLPISFIKAILGGEIEIPTIDGTKVSIQVPSGTQNGDKLRLRNKGMSKMRSSSRGDMFAHMHVEIPKKLTKKQTELLETLEKEFVSNVKDDGNFFDKMKDLWS